MEARGRASEAEAAEDGTENRPEVAVSVEEKEPGEGGGIREKGDIELYVFM